MLESKHYFYLWRHRYVDDNDQVITRTCFGITGNPDNRRNGYEGHVGHPVKFLYLWSGPQRLIRELEDKLKKDFSDYLFTGHRNYTYEWITEEVDFNAILQYVQWEIDGVIGIESVQID